MFNKNHQLSVVRFGMILVLVIGLLGAMPARPVLAATLIRYVKWDADGTNDGSSWADAFTDLQSALSAASSGDEIWVVAGTYTPTMGTDRTVSFILKNGVAIYGGFVGGETTRDQRDPDPATNGTVLSGDLNGDDGPDFANNSENSYHVVIGGSTDATAILDGFTITGGNASGDGYAQFGGGMYNTGGGPMLMNMTFSGNLGVWGGGISNNQSNPIITNVRFSDNVAHQMGAGIYNSHSSPILTDVTFSSNSAGVGGGMYNYQSNPTLTDVTFNGNKADGGGGMSNLDSSNATLTNVTFSNNFAVSDGGGMYNNDSSPVLTKVTFNNNSTTEDIWGYGGGMYNTNSNAKLTTVTFSGNSSNKGGGMYNSLSNPKLTNVTFSGNSAAESGGGMCNLGEANPTLTNVTFSGNSAQYYGGGIYNDYYSNPKIRNTILWGNSADIGPQLLNRPGSSSVISYSVLQGGCPARSTCSNLVTTNPLLGSLEDYGFPLQIGSSAIETGNDTICPSTDQRGVARPQGSHCDIGAFEFSAPPPTPSMPTNGEVLLHKRPIFDWSDVSDASAYKVVVSNDSTFSTLLWKVDAVNSTYTPPADLPAGKITYWRVRALVNGVWSPWSETWDFTTPKPPSVPVLVSPVHKAITRDYILLLDWNDSTLPSGGAAFDYYQVQVSVNKAFTEPTMVDAVTSSGEIGDSSYAPDVDLAANTKYYWRVRSFNVDGQYSSWSTVWSFSTALLPPGNLTPTGGEAVDNRKPLLDWDVVEGASGYSIQISTSDSFSTLLVNTPVATDTFTPSTKLPANTLLYWRVRATGTNGPSLWTTASFRTP